MSLLQGTGGPASPRPRQRAVLCTAPGHGAVRVLGALPAPVGATKHQGSLLLTAPTDKTADTAVIEGVFFFFFLFFFSK